MKFIPLIFIALSCIGAIFAYNSSPSRLSSRLYSLSKAKIDIKPKEVLIVGGTRFAGLYLWKELYDRGHKVTLYNRGKTALSKLRGESDAAFKGRISSASFIHGDRKDLVDLKAKLVDRASSFDVVYDMGGREVADTAPIVDLFNNKNNNKIEHFIYMSSAGVYKKATCMPHREGDEEDPSSRHKGKLETEAYLRQSGIPFTSIRPTYIYGPGNYNPLEQWFFERLDDSSSSSSSSSSISDGSSSRRPLCIPGHGQHITGLGHVEDLAAAMAQVIGREEAVGKIYNIQGEQSPSFQGLALHCGMAMGVDPTDIPLHFYDKAHLDKALAAAEAHEQGQGQGQGGGEGRGKVFLSGSSISSAPSTKPRWTSTGSRSGA